MILKEENGGSGAPELSYWPSGQLFPVLGFGW